MMKKLYSNKKFINGGENDEKTIEIKRNKHCKS